MITKLLDERGETIHDCAAQLCSISVDGFVRDAVQFGRELAASGATAAQIAAATGGSPVTNRLNLDPAFWRVNGNTAMLVSPVVSS